MTMNFADKIHWNELRLTDTNNDEITGQQRLEALSEFKATETMDGFFFAPIGAPHEIEDDASTWGPESPAAVDWAGFVWDEAEELAEKIRNSDEWDEELLWNLCKMAGLSAEWESAQDEDVERVAFKAAEILGVDIL